MRTITSNDFSDLATDRKRHRGVDLAWRLAGVGLELRPSGDAEGRAMMKALLTLSIVHDPFALTVWKR